MIRTATNALTEIVAHHRRRVGDDPRPLDALLETARATETPRSFEQAIAGRDLSVIAEVKRRSPSKGDIAPELKVGELAEAYAKGGASCISVLTDERFFAGSMDDLVVAREAAPLPVLRKDFTLSGNDICDARLAGADAVLLIAAILDDRQLLDFGGLARELGMAALVEAHTEGEVERAVVAGARIIGINQRDLTDFSVDAQRAARMVKLIPEGVIAVAESGISGPADSRRAFNAGYQAVLVGEALVRSSDPAGAVRELICS